MLIGAGSCWSAALGERWGCHDKRRSSASDKRSDTLSLPRKAIFRARVLIAAGWGQGARQTLSCKLKDIPEAVAHGT